MASKFPDLNPIEHLLDVLDKQVRSMEAPASQDLPQHTLRALVESIPRRGSFIRQEVIMLCLIGVFTCFLYFAFCPDFMLSTEMQGSL